MKPLSTVLGRGKEGSPVAVMEPAPANEEQREKLYPKTIEGVLQRLKNLAVENTSENTLTAEGNLARNMLMEIAREGLHILKSKAASTGKDWQGRVEFFGHLGFEILNMKSIGAIIEEDGLTIFDETSRSIGNVNEYVAVRQKIDQDETEIYWTEIITSKTFGDEEVLIEKLRVDFVNGRLKTLSFAEMDGQPDENTIGSFYVRPQGPMREFKITLAP